VRYGITRDESHIPSEVFHDILQVVVDRRFAVSNTGAAITLATSAGASFLKGAQLRGRSRGATGTSSARVAAGRCCLA
jgi:hypothetical protein